MTVHPFIEAEKRAGRSVKRACELLKVADQRVRELEAQEEQERQKAVRERERVSFKIQPQRSHEGALLHRGDCGLYKSPFGYISAEDTAVALDEPDIEACQICLPDDALPPV
ncbi:DUF6233 domain-containing protein [Streptomyces sp. NPDC052299]|uniref:DUF6233 domain-containing protein n=1 Tax=Streptomyces sp. NPDC052299 TaxID=3155054 RepID=UPI00342C4632